VIALNDEMTRRAALARFAVLAGGVTTSAMLPASLVHAAPAQGFTAQRRAVFATLAEAFDGLGPITTAGHDLTSEMARRYSAGTDGYRVRVDALLDAVDSAPQGLRFHAQSTSDRRRQVRTWSTATEPADALMQRPRPGDTSGPTSLKARNEAIAAQVRTAWAAIPEADRKPDPTTALLPDAPATPPGPPSTDGKGPLGTPVRMGRYLYYSSYMLLASFFIEDMDPKYVTLPVSA
jgi:hypothetical protein